MSVRRTTTARGLGQRHRQQVAHLKSIHIEGTPCWWCGKPMFLRDGLSGDHSVPRSRGGTLADRLLHAACNSARGDGSRDDERPAITGKHQDDDTKPVGHTVLKWPWAQRLSRCDERDIDNRDTVTILTS